MVFEGIWIQHRDCPRTHIHCLGFCCEWHFELINHVAQSNSPYGGTILIFKEQMGHSNGPNKYWRNNRLTLFLQCKVCVSSYLFPLLRVGLREECANNPFLPLKSNFLSPLSMLTKPCGWCVYVDNVSQMKNFIFICHSGIKPVFSSELGPAPPPTGRLGKLITSISPSSPSRARIH